jgi:hypothetical protein
MVLQSYKYVADDGKVYTIDHDFQVGAFPIAPVVLGFELADGSESGPLQYNKSTRGKGVHPRLVRIRGIETNQRATYPVGKLADYIGLVNTGSYVITQKRGEVKRFR